MKLGGRVLVIGDTIIDIYHEGTPLGVSTETPTLVVRHDTTRTTIGGAGFLVRNLLALGGRVTFLTTLGKDAYAEHVKKFSHPRLTKALLVCPDGTTVKERFWSGTSKLLAWDRVANKPLPEPLARKALTFVKKRAKAFDAIVVSDYRHGFISKAMAQEIVKIARHARVPLLVDSQVARHEANHRWYKGADLFCLNLKEAKAIDPSFNERQLEQSLKRVARVLQTRCVILKRGALGSVALSDGTLVETPGFKVPVTDTTGAGDAFFAVIALNKKVGPEALAAANAWAALKVALKGTETPALVDLQKLLATQPL
jgi:D-beta-D-heptose 7-phosphate kinase/D-beta-D-heptose 1-phosphate adenosyltransferase